MEIFTYIHTDTYIENAIILNYSSPKLIHILVELVNKEASGVLQI